MTMPRRRLGVVEVGAIGLGGMPMSVEGRPQDEARCIATVHAALDAGVTLIDTADAYHLADEDVGHNEALIAKALASYGGDRDDVLVATKGGHIRHRDGFWELNGSPEHLRAACEASLRRLGVEAIGLYQLHRPDPDTPFEESVAGLRDLLDAGKVRMVGISNTDVEQIRLADDILGGRLTSVQNEFSPAFRSSEPEIRLCEEMGKAFLPWRPLGGVGTGGGVAAIARDRGVSPQRVSLAWMLALSPCLIPIPGASRPETIRDSAAAAGLSLAPAEIAALSRH
jgi:aryl-alcohol dehydrogenase-like predicted oxidoreductase